MSGAANLYDTVVFTRNYTEFKIASAIQNADHCSVDKIPPGGGYRLLCVAGTDKAGADTKLYVLEIKAISKIDITDWTCYLNARGKYSNVYTVTYLGKWY